MEQDCFQFGLVVIWAIWMSRNAVVMNGEVRNCYGTAKFATSFYKEYKNGIRREEKIICKEIQTWHKPSQGLIKINFDGSLNVRDRRGGLGIIARNDKREVVGAVQAFIEGTTNPMVVETHAAIRALTFEKDMEFTRIMLEGDALTVITKILQSEPCLSEIGNLVDAAKELVKSFDSCKVQYIRREVNEAAHCLAKSALSLEEDLYCR